MEKMSLGQWVHGPFIFFKKKNQTKKKERMKTQDKTKQNKTVSPITNIYSPIPAISHQIGNFFAAIVIELAQNSHQKLVLVWEIEKTLEILSQIGATMTTRKNCRSGAELLICFNEQNKTKQTFKKKIVRVLMYMNSIMIIKFFLKNIQTRRKTELFFRLEFLKLLRCVMPIIKHLC